MPRVSEGCLPSDYTDYMKGSNSNHQDPPVQDSLKKEQAQSNNFTKVRPFPNKDNDLNVISPGMLEKGTSDKTEDVKKFT